MSGITADDLLAARKAAYDCLLAVEMLSLSASDLTMPPAVEKLLSPFKVENGRTKEEIQTDIRRSSITDAVEGLCKALDDNDWDKIGRVKDRLLQVSGGPVSIAGIVRSTVHEAAYYLAHHLWLGSRQILESQSILQDRGIYEAGPGFCLERARIEENVEPIRAEIRGMGPFNYRAAKAAVEIESAKAAAAATQDHRTTPSENQNVGGTTPLSTENAYSEETNSRPAELVPFGGGTMVFYPDRVELCGRTICGGPRCEQARKTLDLLRQKNTKGDFIAFGSRKLAEMIGRKGGSPSVTGLIRDIRTRISEELRSIQIQCGRYDVIERTDHGYHLRDSISVRDGEAIESPAIEGHNDATSLDDVPVNGTVDVPVDSYDADPVSESADAAVARQKWILEQVTKGRKLRAPGFAAELGCSDRTVKRDLDTLERQIEFVGSPRTGYYQLRQVHKPR